MHVRGLAHLSLFVSDIERSLAFYTKVLGFTKTYYQDRADIFYAEIAAGNCVAEVVQWKDPSENGRWVGKRGTLDHVALEVANLDAAAAELSGAGIPIVDGPFELPDLNGGIRGLFIHGPDGERVELLQKLSK